MNIYFKIAQPKIGKYKNYVETTVRTYTEGKIRMSEKCLDAVIATIKDKLLNYVDIIPPKEINAENT